MIKFGHIQWFVISDYFSSIKQNCPVADGGDRIRAMRHQQNRFPCCSKGSELVKALFLKASITYRQSFVNDEYSGIDRCLDGKRETHHHACTIRFDRLLNEFSDVGKCHD